MEMTILLSCVLISLTVWKSSLWIEKLYKLQNRLVLKFEFHSDEFFKHANRVVEHPESSKRWIRQMLKLCDIIEDKTACKQFIEIFGSSTPNNHQQAAQFKSELDSIPQDLRDAILTATFHAVLAVSYNSFWPGFILRALIADVFEKPKDKINSAQIVMNGLKNPNLNHNDMATA